MESAEQRSMSMWMQTLPKKGFFVILSIFALIFVIQILIGGLLGPDIWTTQSYTSWNCSTDNITVFDPSFCNGVDLAADNISEFSTVLMNMNKLNQQIRLETQVGNIWYDGISTDLSWHIRIMGRMEDDDITEWTLITEQYRTRGLTCSKNTYWCDAFYLIQIPYIKFNHYQFQIGVINPPSAGWMRDVKFTFKYITADNTLFELWWRFAFLLITFVFIIGFVVLLRRFRWTEWSIEQKWTSILLFAVLGYDNPFFPLTILVTNWFPIFLNEVLMATFYCLLFFFWLVMFDGIRKESTSINFITFYLPKILYMGACWALIIALLTWAKLQQVDNYSFDAVTELSGYLFLAVLLLLGIICYVFWILFAVFRACIEAKGLTYLGSRLRFFGIYTMVCMVIVVIVFAVAFLSPYTNNNAARFLSTISVGNLYVYVLAIMYVPSKEAKPAMWGDRTGMKRLGEEEADNSLTPEETPEGAATGASDPAQSTDDSVPK